MPTSKKVTPPAIAKQSTDQLVAQALSTNSALGDAVTARFAGIGFLGADLIAVVTAKTSAPSTALSAYKNRLSEMTLAAKQRVAADPQTFVVLGRVVDATGAGLKGYKLTLSDANGDLSRVAPVVSDADGFFTLHLRLGELPPSVVGGSIYVRVSDPKGSEIFAPSAPLTVRGGEVGSFSAISPVAATPNAIPKATPKASATASP